MPWLAHDSVSLSRFPNRTGSFPASGFPSRPHCARLTRRIGFARWRRNAFFFMRLPRCVAGTAATCLSGWSFTSSPCRCASPKRRGYSGFRGLRQLFRQTQHSFKAVLTEALSLHRSYPASKLLWTSLQPSARDSRLDDLAAVRPMGLSDALRIVLYRHAATSTPPNR